MSKATVQFLNVGWGDAHLIHHPSGQLTLIDGGDGSVDSEQDHPLLWMIRNGKLKLDWMILTHIHEDHLNGLLDIAKALRVDKAILPYEPLELPPQELAETLGTPQARGVYGMLFSYMELIRVLEEQGTEIKWRSRLNSEDSSVVWSEAGVTLRHLYPWEGDPLPAWEVLAKAVGDHSAEGMVALESFFDLSNHDSSVYRLTEESLEEGGVLFGGDQLEPGWERLAKRTNLQCQIWKVAHHGMSDGLNVRLLELIKPKLGVIPVSEERGQPFRPYWEELRASAGFAYWLTGNVPPGESRLLADGPIRVEVGS
ncbi:ComEC/Rec2 family competence protein [Paenibacillus hodogayensis]|uniref:ComEC/Rec2 family competence protein n=1 Tax=Paenibacillus hodogayensis TaxID=279208 RepID=A0ABV5VUQ4_9BACL